MGVLFINTGSPGKWYRERFMTGLVSLSEESALLGEAPDIWRTSVIRLPQQEAGQCSHMIRINRTFDPTKGGL